MKKRLTFLFLIFCLSQTKVLCAENLAANFATEAGIANQINNNGLRELNIEKNDLILPNQQKEDSNKQNGIVINPAFQLKKINFTGNTIFSDKELSKITENLNGKTIYISDIYNAIEEINKIYYENGYFTSYAYLPPQKITDNTITVGIVESKIGKIEIDGNKYSKTAYLKTDILAPNNLKEGEIFNAFNVKKALSDINEKDYIKGKIAVEENSKPNLTDIKLKVDERYPLSFNVIWDNLGNSINGKQRNVMLLSQNNLFGLGHTIYGGTILSNGTSGVLAGYKMPIGKYGTELDFNYSYANVNLLNNQAIYDFNGKARTFNVKAIQPIINSYKYDLTTDLGMDITSVTCDNDINQSYINNYKLAVARHGITLKEYDEKGIFAGRYETSFGVPILGATQDNYGYFDHNGTEPKSNFLKFKLDLTRLQKLPKDCFGIFRISTQYSPNNLYPTEQLLMSGISSIRGIEPGNCLADLGVNGTVELRSPVPFFKKVLPMKYKKYAKNVKIGYFYDWGVFSQQHTGIQMNSTSNFLQSVGTGLHINLMKNLVASFEIAMPIASSNYKTQDCMFLFSIRADVWDIFSKKPKVSPL